MIVASQGRMRRVHQGPKSLEVGREHAIDGLFHASGLGHHVPETPEQIAGRLAWLMDNREAAIDLGRGVRDWFDRNASQEIVTERLIAVYSRLKSD